MITIIMEYCGGGDLSQLIKQGEKIAEDVIWKIFSQIVMALHECHRHPGGAILHRDLKPSNIFLSEDLNIKLGDFGLSKQLKKDEANVWASTNVGTPYYMSPEQINGTNYDEKSDIWSLGCVLFEMAALKPPFRADNHLNLAMRIKDGKLKRIPCEYTEDLDKAIRMMIKVDPHQRPSIEDLT